jgi:hypothetical protein
VDEAQKLLEKMQSEMKEKVKVFEERKGADFNEDEPGAPPELEDCSVVRRTCVMGNAHFLPVEIMLEKPKEKSKEKGSDDEDEDEEEEED